MLNVTLLTACLLGALTEFTVVNVTYVLCPGSSNCVCPWNITGILHTTAAPRCVKLEKVDLFCDRNFLVFDEAMYIIC